MTARDGLRPGQNGARKSSRPARRRTASWHGRIFEYFRNDTLDAVPHEVAQRGGERNLLRRNQFGFSASGPIVVPKLYNGRGQTFFTFTYEGTRESVGRTFLTSLPAAQQRLGDFSDLVDRAGHPLTVYDPQSTRRNPLHDPNEPVNRSNLEYDRAAFPNNRIPEHRIDPVARRVNDFYPLPNTNVGPFLRNNFWSNPTERGTPNGFIARIDHNLGGRQKLTLDLSASDGFVGTAKIYPTAGAPSSPDRRFQNRAIDLADTINLSPRLTYRASFRAGSRVTDTIFGLGGQDLPAELGLRGVSGEAFPSFRFLGYGGLGPSSRSYLRTAWNTYRAGNEFIWRNGRHTWTIATSALFVEGNTLELDSPSGEFSFDDHLTGLPGITNTGDSYATFLLGEAYRAEATDQTSPAYLRRKEFENSFSDQWQVSGNLTLTVAMDVEITTPRTEKFDRQSTFDPQALNAATSTPGALVFANRDGETRAFQPIRTRVEPKLNFSWSPSRERTTVLRGSVQRSYSAIPLRAGPFATQGFSGRRFPVSPNRQLTPAAVLEDGLPGLANPLPDLRSDFANNTNVDMIPDTSAQPTYNRAEIEIERKMPSGLILRAVGKMLRARDLLIGGHIVGLNRPPVETLAFRDRLNDESFRSSLRPFPHFQDVHLNYQYPGGRYHSNEMEINLQKRTGDGLSFDLEYELRKSWDDFSGSGVQNPHDRSTAWALTAYQRPQQLSLSYTYELPLGPGKAALNRSGLLGKVMGDWSVSGFTRWLAGDPIRLQPLFNNTGGVVRFLRVNSVARVDPQVDNPGPGLWFNPAAFVDPADFTLGSVPRTHPTLRNPSYRNHDIAVTKRLSLSQEQSLEFLVQAFNFLNQGNWNQPDPYIGPAHAPNENAGKIIGSAGGRVMQLGLRYHF